MRRAFRSGVCPWRRARVHASSRSSSGRHIDRMSLGRKGLSGRPNGPCRTIRTVAAEKTRRIYTPGLVDVRYLADQLKIPITSVARHGMDLFRWWPQQTKKQMKNEGYATIDSLILRFDEAEKLIEAEGHSAVFVDVDQDPHSLNWMKNRPEDRRSRDAVVGVLGHIDHGKTTLLDGLAGTTLAMREPGSITQDIRCVGIQMGPEAGQEEAESTGMHVTFVDTPGHEVFTNMRRAGSYFADAALVVVDVEEGCREQTYQSLELAQEHGSPVLLALNKMDLLGHSEPTACLTDHRVHAVLRDVESMGFNLRMDAVAPRADTAIPVPISALHGTNVAALMSTLGQMIRELNPTADFAGIPTGAVLDSFNQRGSGHVLRVLLQRGCVSVGDEFVAGLHTGRIRGLREVPSFEWGASTRASNTWDLEVSPRAQVAKGPSVKQAAPGKCFEVVATLHEGSQYGRKRKRQRESASSLLSMAPPSPGDSFFAKLPPEYLHLIAMVRKLDAKWEQQLREPVDEDVKWRGPAEDLGDQSTDIGSDVGGGVFDGQELVGVAPDFIPTDSETEAESRVEETGSELEAEELQELAHMSVEEEQGARSGDDTDGLRDPRWGWAQASADMPEDLLRTRIEHADHEHAGSEAIECPVVVRASNSASLDAILELLKQPMFVTRTHSKGDGEEEDRRFFAFRVVGSGIGTPTEGDVKLASTCEAAMLCYKLPRLSNSMKMHTEQRAVDVFQFDVFYALTEFASRRAFPHHKQPEEASESDSIPSL